jgi:hypothetical protein
MFHEILDYLSTRDSQYLGNHLSLIDEMTQYRSSGWNRYSQFITLALAGGQLDYAWKGLAAALSWIVGRPLKHSEVAAEAANLAQSGVAPDKSRDPGPIELAVHLAMWGQYEWALVSHGAKTSSAKRSAEFFAVARQMLVQQRHLRFIRDLDRFLYASQADPLLLTQTRVPGHVRSYGPTKHSTAVFFPLVPEFLPIL